MEGIEGSELMSSMGDLMGVKRFVMNECVLRHGRLARLRKNCIEKSNENVRGFGVLEELQINRIGEKRWNNKNMWRLTSFKKMYLIYK